MVVRARITGLFLHIFSERYIRTFAWLFHAIMSTWTLIRGRKVEDGHFNDDARHGGCKPGQIE